MSSLRSTVFKPTTASATSRKPSSVSYAPTRGTRVRPAKPTPQRVKGTFPTNWEGPSRCKRPAAGALGLARGRQRPPAHAAGPRARPERRPGSPPEGRGFDQTDGPSAGTQGSVVIGERGRIHGFPRTGDGVGVGVEIEVRIMQSPGADIPVPVGRGPVDPYGWIRGAGRSEFNGSATTRREAGAAPPLLSGSGSCRAVP